VRCRECLEQARQGTLFVVRWDDDAYHAHSIGGRPCCVVSLSLRQPVQAHPDSPQSYRDTTLASPVTSANRAHIFMVASRESWGGTRDLCDEGRDRAYLRVCAPP